MGMIICNTAMTTFMNFIMGMSTGTVMFMNIRMNTIMGMSTGIVMFMNIRMNTIMFMLMSIVINMIPTMSMTMTIPTIITGMDLMIMRIAKLLTSSP